MQETHILIVEDDEDDYILAVDYSSEITFLNIVLTRAVTAEDAIDSLKNHPFDLCLLDYQLGATTGLDVLKQAQQQGIQTPIIMLTGQADERLDQDALDAGAVDYLIKSELNTARFARAIRYALARKEVEKERVERLKAESENRSKNRFLAHLSHELRTPLTAILGYTELLLNNKNDHARRELNIILRNGKHLLNLLNDVLDLSKIAANKLEINQSSVNLVDFLTDIHSLLQVTASDKGINLSLDSNDNVPSIIKTDPTRLRQILINLIGNAIKFTEQGRVQISLYCQGSGADERLCFDIKDTGLGIPQDKLNTIFDPFTQVADVLSKSTGGSGLGLAISLELSKRLGGGISVTSTEGVGSCFTLTIRSNVGNGVERKPISVLNQEILPLPKTVQSLAGKILIADDLEEIRMLVAHLIESAGARVVHAENGKHALKKIEEAHLEEDSFDVILMDIHMPIMDGTLATQMLRSTGDTTPVIALTAASMKGTNEKLINIGFDHVLNKPIDSKNLIETLQLYIPKDPNAITEPDPVSLDNTVNLLIVEDDYEAGLAIAELLRTLGHNCTLVQSYQKAIESVKHNHFNGILTDLNLPDGNGLELAKQIRQSPSTTNSPPYIALITGEQLEMTQGRQALVNTILTKPLSFAQLSSLATKILNHSHL